MVWSQIDNVNPTDYFTFAADQHHHATRQATNFSLDGMTTAPCSNIVKQPARLDLRRNFFMQRVVGPWNALPTTVKTATSVNQFKARYDNFTAC